MDPILLPRAPHADWRHDVEARISRAEASRRVYDQYVCKYGPEPGTTAYFGSFSGRSTSSATFVTLWHTYLPTISHPAIAFASYCLAAVGHEAEVRLIISDSAGSTTSPVATIVGNAAFRFIGVDWLHGRALWTGAAEVVVQARRTVGVTDPITIAPIQSTLRDGAQCLITPGWTVT